MISCHRRRLHHDCFSRFPIRSEHDLLHILIFRQKTRIEIIQHLPCRLITKSTVFGSCFNDDILNGLRQRRVKLPYAGNFFTQMPHSDLYRIIPFKRDAPREKFIKHDAQCINIDLIGRRFAARCFRCKIMGAP